MDISLLNVSILVSIGIIAGIIGTLAGGGSNLTLPALMVLGMPPEVANATNRVGVFLRSVVGLKGFHANDRLDTQDVGPILVPTLIGGVLGAFCASFSPAWIVKPLLLGAMLIMSLIILLKPSVISPPPGTLPNRVRSTPASWWGLGFAGFYGGLVEAGVGFILLGALAGTLRYQLVNAIALKILLTMAFTGVALVVFVARGQVLWVPGLILAVGTMIGAYIAVKIAIRVKPEFLKWFLFVMTVCGCIAAYLS
jgi:uncharacterized membrane protein YfcA